MGRQDSVSVQASCGARGLQGRRPKKRLSLTGFRQAVKLHIAGAASGDCEWEPRWREFFPRIAKPEASDSEKAEVREWLDQQTVTCSKLKMSPTACFGCPDNPIGPTQQAADQQMLDAHANDLVLVESLHAAARMNLLRLADLSAEEFSMVSAFWFAVEGRLRSQL